MKRSLFILCTIVGTVATVSLADAAFSGDAFASVDMLAACSGTETVCVGEHDCYRSCNADTTDCFTICHMKNDDIE